MHVRAAIDTSLAHAVIIRAALLPAEDAESHILQVATSWDVVGPPGYFERWVEASGSEPGKLREPKAGAQRSRGLVCSRPPAIIESQKAEQTLAVPRQRGSDQQRR